MSDEETREPTERIEIAGGLDRHAAEGLKLEIERLARRHGVEIGDLRITKAPKPKMVDPAP